MGNSSGSVYLMFQSQSSSSSSSSRSSSSSLNSSSSSSSTPNAADSASLNSASASIGSGMECGTRVSGPSTGLKESRDIANFSFSGNDPVVNRCSQLPAQGRRVRGQQV